MQAGPQPSAAQGQHRWRHPADLCQSSLLLMPLTWSPSFWGRPRQRGNHLGQRAGDHAQPMLRSTASRYTWRSMAAASLFFCFFYVAVVFNPEETADNLKRQRRLHPGHPPGQEHQRPISTMC